MLTKIIGALFPEAETRVKEAQCWRQVAFCNFIQTVFEGPGRRPTVVEWSAGREPLEEVFDLVQPERVLVVGKEAWTQVSKVFEATDPLDLGHGNSHELSVGSSKQSGKRFVATWLYHPSQAGGLFKSAAAREICEALSARRV